MFSSKSNRGKWAWAFVDLLVVIIGVYIAFLIQSSAAGQKEKREQLKIYSALKMELEAFRVGFPQFAAGNISFLEEIKDDDNYDISGWRFIEPQYGYQILEYALSIQNTDIVDFQTYENLKTLFVRIKQLEHMERLITDAAGEYQYLIPELDNNHPMNLERKANNRSRIDRFKMFLRGRAGALNNVAEITQPLLESINQHLGPELKLEIDKRYIKENVGWIGNEEQAVGMITKYFPHITPEEASHLYNEAASSN